MSTSQPTINVTDYTDDYSISCAFRGIPEPKVSWYFDGKLITSSSRYTVNNTATQNGVFHNIHSELKFEGMLHLSNPINGIGKTERCGEMQIDL